RRGPCCRRTGAPGSSAPGTASTALPARSVPHACPKAARPGSASCGSASPLLSPFPPELELPPFQLEQKPLPPKSARKAADRPIAMDDAVTRDHDRNRILAERVAHRARCSRNTDPDGQRSIGYDGAVFHPPRDFPHPPLEWRPLGQIEPQIERRLVPREVVLERPTRRIGPARPLHVADAERARFARGGSLPFAQPEPAEPRRGREDPHRPLLGRHTRRRNLENVPHAVAPSAGPTSLKILSAMRGPIPGTAAIASTGCRRIRSSDPNFRSRSARRLGPRPGIWSSAEARAALARSARW